jgi:hypothetical protein
VRPDRGRLEGATSVTTSHHVDDYSVLSLDDLVVRLVSEELAPLSGSGQL